MILLVGKAETLWFAQEAAKRLGLDVEYVEAAPRIHEQTNKILRYRNPAPQAIIYDASQYMDEPTVAANEAAAIGRSNNSKVIIYTGGANEYSDLVLAYKDAGFRNFIYTSRPQDQVDEAEKHLNGYFEANNHPDATTAEDIEVDPLRPGLSIGVCGVIPRIGTTTQCIQIIKHVLSKGLRACYIDMTDGEYLRLMSEYYSDLKRDDDLGMISYQSVDMFRRIDVLPEIKKMGYDYMVYDYGVFGGPDFKRESFLERDIRIFVAGSSPTEIAAGSRVLENVFYEDASFIYSFVAEEEKQDLLEIMEERAAKTWFAPYCPDPFVYSNDSIYDRLLPLETEVEEAPRRGLFRRRRK